MVRLTAFSLVWLLFFFIPLFLSIYDNRMFFLPIVFLMSEVWRVWTHFIGGEWVPTPQRIVDKMLKIAKVNKNDTVYDLGSGDGKIVLAAAKVGSKSIGVEIDPIRVLISRIKIKLSRLDKLTEVVRKNIFETNIKDADVITLFLLPKTMEKLENKLRKELRKGARVVSYRFVFKNWKPVKIDGENKIYLYKV